MNADTIAMFAELGIIAPLIPMLVVAIRHELRRRRIRRKIQQLQPAIDGIVIAMQGLGRAFEAVLPTVLDLAEALKPIAAAADAVGRPKINSAQRSNQ